MKRILMAVAIAGATSLPAFAQDAATMVCADYAAMDNAGQMAAIAELEVSERRDGVQSGNQFGRDPSETDRRLHGRSHADGSLQELLQLAPDALQDAKGPQTPSHRSAGNCFRHDLPEHLDYAAFERVLSRKEQVRTDRAPERFERTRSPHFESGRDATGARYSVAGPPCSWAGPSSIVARPERR